MRFSLFYELQLPRPWDPDSEHRLFNEALDQIELADKLGFHCAWAVEHHFLEEYAHSSASDVFLAAASQRTEKIRLGLGIVPLPLPYNHPARVAETVSTLDLVSDGRVEFGTGETSSANELGGFGVDRATKREQWAESLDVVTRMMAEEPFAGHEGHYISIPPRNVVPKPRQKPHPPLWVACSQRETIRMAAEKGLGALSFSFSEPEEAKAWIDEYYEIIASDRCVPAGFSINPNFAIAMPMMVADKERVAIARGVDGANFFGYSLAHYYAFGNHRPGFTSIREEFDRRRDEMGFHRNAVKPNGERLSMKVVQAGLGSSRGAIGTPEQVIELARRYEDAGVDEMLFAVQTGSTKHEHIREALELFAAEVMPEFAHSRAQRESDKQHRLERAMAQAVMRRDPPRSGDHSYVVSRAGENLTGPRVGHRGPRVVIETARKGAASRIEEIAKSLVRRTSDDRLDQIAGSEPVLRMLFAAMERRYVPEHAGGFAGEIQYDLNRGGVVRSWTLSLDQQGAHARQGESLEPQLTISAAVADFIRIATGELEPGRALLDGRLQVRGDLMVAARLGAMFGHSKQSPF